MIGGYLITRGEPTTLHALESLLPHVDRMVVAIDSRADRIWDKTFQSYGVENYRFDFLALLDFAALGNQAQFRAGHSWTIGIDADEILEGGEAIRATIDQAECEGCDLVWVPRRHWLDFRKSNEHGSWFPDFQPRLRKANVILHRRIHPAPIGSAKSRQTSRLIFNHFNLAIRDDEAWREVNEFYEEIRRLDGID